MTSSISSHLTLVLPSLNRSDVLEHAKDFHTPALNQLLRFGRFTSKPMRPSECMGQFLWQGSLLDLVRRAVRVESHVPAVLASPVWLQMGMHHMDMLGADEIGVSAEEAATLCEGLSEFYGEGWAFHVYRPGIWLLELPFQPDWHICSVQDVLGQNDGSVRAEGENARLWLQLQTEIQMWLHQQPLNTARTQQGLPAINGAWLWSDSVGKADESMILMADGDWADAYQGCRVDAPYDFTAFEQLALELSSHHNVIYLNDFAPLLHTSDVWGYQEMLHQFEQRWFEPIWQALRHGRLASFTLTTDGEAGGSVTVAAKAGKAFWKKQRRFNGQLGG